ncbi:MAG: LytTR family DNA-binding domain-containing protein [Terracidiphilus sp.]|jgi:DNA-binding LytR/AlgR family response regulator
MKALAFELPDAPELTPMAGPTPRAPKKAFPMLLAPARPWSPRVAIKVKGRILFIHPGDVVAIEAHGNNVMLQRGDCWYSVRESISAAAEKLQSHGFIRIHRSVLVNGSFVEEIIPYSTGEYGLRVKGGKEYTVTRSYKKNLKLLAEISFGAGTFFRDWWP